MQMEAKPMEVLEKAKQTGETRSRREWVEPSVWTDKMLTALENGVKGDNEFFVEHGLFSLYNAYVGIRQSLS